MAYINNGSASSTQNTGIQAELHTQPRGQLSPSPVPLPWARTRGAVKPKLAAPRRPENRPVPRKAPPGAQTGNRRHLNRVLKIMTGSHHSLELDVIPPSRKGVQQTQHGHLEARVRHHRERVEHRVLKVHHFIFKAVGQVGLTKWAPSSPPSAPRSFTSAGLC